MPHKFLELFAVVLSRIFQVDQSFESGAQLGVVRLFLKSIAEALVKEVSEVSCPVLLITKVFEAVIFLRL